MAKLKITNLKQVQTKIRQDLTKILRSKEVRQTVGEIVVSQIQEEITPVTSEKTIAMRKYYEKKNKTSAKYMREFINITFTGELLNDLMKNVKARFTGGNSDYVIEHSDKTHKKYKKPNGKTTGGSPKKYKEIQGYLEKLGYDYLKFSDKSKERVIEFIKKSLFDGIKRRK